MSSVKNSITKITLQKSGPWAIGLHKVILALGRGLMESPNMDFYLRPKWHFVLLLRCAAQVPKSDFDIESSLKGLASGPQKSKIEGQKFCLGFRCSLRCQSDLWRHFVGPPLSGKKNLRMYAAVWFLGGFSASATNFIGEKCCFPRRAPQHKTTQNLEEKVDIFSRWRKILIDWQARSDFTALGLRFQA